MAGSYVPAVDIFGMASGLGDTLQQAQELARQRQALEFAPITGANPPSPLPAPGGSLFRNLLSGIQKTFSPQPQQPAAPAGVSYAPAQPSRPAGRNARACHGGRGSEDIHAGANSDMG